MLHYSSLTMKPIDIIGLKNFRIFDDQMGFLGDLSSINIFTGANNSGKSSIIKALQMLKNSSKQNQFPLRLDLNQQEHFLGDFNNVLYNKESRDLTISLPFTFLGMKNIYIYLKYEIPESKNTFSASLRTMKIVDKSDQSVVFSFAYRTATDGEKEDSKKTFEAEMEDYNAQKKETPNLLEAFSSEKSRWLIPPHHNPLEGYIEWSMNLEKLKNYLSELRKFYLAYIENKGKWIALDKIDERAHDIFFTPSILVECFKKDVDATSWNNFMDNKIGSRKELQGKEPVGEYDFDSDEFYFPRPEIEDLLYWKTVEIFKNQLIWNITEDDTTISILASSFESSWKALIQRVSTISYISNIKEENARIYSANVNSPFVNLLKEYINLDYHDTAFIKKYLKIFEIGKDVEVDYDPKYQLIKVIITTFDDIERELVDFGYGIKQLVLILIQISILAKRSKEIRHEYDQEYGEVFKDYYAPGILLIEEPESNLHPKWQSVLAEMFVEANSTYKIQLIIETHSEYLIRRFQTLVAKGELKADGVKIFYLRNSSKVTTGKKQVESLHIDQDGRIDYTMFDGGFFDESDNLELSLLNIQRENFLKDFEDLKKNSKESKDKIIDLQQKIDAYTQKFDVAVYHQIVSQRIDISKLSPMSVQYMESGQFLLNTIDPTSDFSPVIIQYGRAIEEEIKQLFYIISSTKKWMIGEMQGSMEKVLFGSTLQPTCSATRLRQLTSLIPSTFNTTANLRMDLIDDLRTIRNSAGHAGQTKTKQEAEDYIQNANLFLDEWIAEKL